MPRRCTACMHPAREAIDAALAAGRSAGSVAMTYKLSPDAVERHRRNHVAVQLAAAARLSAPGDVVAAPVHRARQIAAGAPVSPAERLDLAGLTSTLSRSLARLEAAANDAAQGKALVALSALSGQITRAIDSVAKLRGIGAADKPGMGSFSVTINMASGEAVRVFTASPTIEADQ